jgi:PGF-pre-PGF domain-containing protein
MLKHKDRSKETLVQLHRSKLKIELVILLSIGMLIFFPLTMAVPSKTSATIGNSLPTIANLELPAIYNLESIVFPALNDTKVNVSVKVRDNNGVNDINLVRIFLTNKSNLRNSFITTTWLTQASLSMNKTVNISTALYNGTLLCPVCQQGDYYLEAQVFDKSGAMGNWLNYANPKMAFRILEIVSYVNQSVTTKGKIPTIINASIVNTTLEFVTQADATGSLNINRSTLALSTPLSGPDPGIYLDIDSKLGSISWAIIKVNYNDADISALGIDESSLRLYYLNSGSWERLEAAGSPPWIFGAGVDIVNNVVWANVSHFSQYAVGGILQPSTTQATTIPASNSGSGSSNSSGGGGASDESYANIVVNEKYDLFIYKDKVTTFKFSNKNNPVLFINISGNVNAGEINTAVEVLRNTSSRIKIPAPGIVYKNINVWVGTSSFAVEKIIKNAQIIFRVDKEWINEINPGSIEMYRFDSEWKKLPTVKISEDNEFEYYRATTQKLSGLAISATKASSDTKYTFDAPPQITRVTSTNANEAIIVDNSSEPEKVKASPGIGSGLMILAVLITVLFFCKT